ncbi:MAG TPA: hypothetical protein VGP24_01590 [Glaciihabitans sp.]|nr:hypothetical protein [Glaciihabitans sp.]
MSWFLVALTAVGLLFPAGLVVAAFRPTRWLKFTSRVGAITSVGDTVIVLIMVRLFVPWGAVPVALWLVPVVLVASGIAGVVLRYAALPTWPAGKPRWSIVVSAIVTGVLLLLALLLAFVV